MVSGVSRAWAVIQAARDGDPTARSFFADTYVPVVRAHLRARWIGRPQAQAIVKAAGRLHEADARRGGEDALRRRRILSFRFHEGLPVREIAARWGMDPDRVHHEYARARGEFLEAPNAVVADHHPGTPAEVRRECEHLRALLG